MRCSHGLTLVELLTTLVIVAIVGTLAVPSFNSSLRDTQRATAVNAFLHTLFFARSEALRNGHVVSVCKSPDGTTCVKSAQWHEGWMVFDNLDRDEPAMRDADEPILLVHQGWRLGTITSTRTSFSFRAYHQGVVNGTVVFCDTRGSEHARAIIISHTGRPRVAQRDASNRALRCPSQRAPP